MIPLINPPKIVEKKENFGVFEIEALYPGYGVTIGNTLRRVLLSSLSGAAITEVRIKGVQHEFSTIPHILEDVITITLNLKKLRFKIYSEEPQKATLYVKGEKTVKGSDFELPSQVELMNKDTHIATLTDRKAELEMEILIEKGVGYVPVERRKKEKSPIGTIYLDAIFTPIRNVAFSVENMRVGERADFDRLKIEVETDGTLSPEDALFQATDILVKQFSIITETFQPKEEKLAKELEPKIPPKTEQIGIEDIKISTRTYNCLQKNKILTVGGILKKGEKGISELEGMGEKGIKEIKKALKKLGLEWQ